MKNTDLIACNIILLLFFLGFYANSKAKHDDEICNILAQEFQIKDSLGTYIQEMAAALDLFTEGHPLVFTAYNALVEQTDDKPNITASNKENFPGVLALRRDLLKRYGVTGDISYGDTVWVVLPMQVEDTMHRPWRNSADVFWVDYHDALQFGHRNGLIYTPEPACVNLES